MNVRLSVLPSCVPRLSPVCQKVPPRLPVLLRARLAKVLPPAPDPPGPGYPPLNAERDPSPPELTCYFSPSLIGFRFLFGPSDYHVKTVLGCTDIGTSPCGLGPPLLPPTAPPMTDPW